jgi:hypothetical protein
MQVSGYAIMGKIKSGRKPTNRSIKGKMKNCKLKGNKL